VNDHISLTGRNPLFGFNENEYGTRFPDMSNAYSRDIRSAVLAAAKSSASALKETVTANVLSDSSRGVAEGRLALALKASSMSSGVADMNVLARHSSMEICALGCVTRSVCGRDANNFVALGTSDDRRFYIERKAASVSPSVLSALGASVHVAVTC